METGKPIIKIRFNKEHAIYKGHFPGKPIVPGVCLIQMIKEVCLEKDECQFKLAVLADCKFLKPVIPKDEDIYSIEFKRNVVQKSVEIRAVLTKDEEAYFKFKGTFSGHLHHA
jgi:3-hydroxyacyl-[acyl-carrier-protein] dehydratase